MRSAPFVSVALLISLAAAGPAAAGDGSFTLFHTNDLHAHFAAEPARWREDRAPVGGFKALAALLREERKNAGANLYLDAGDFLTGTPLSDLEHRGARGGAIVEFYNAVGLDAMTIGNHEFDQTVGNARKLIALADFPVFGANLRRAGGDLFTGEAYRIFERGGVRVGVVGVTTDALDGLLGAAARESLRVAAAATVLPEILAAIDDETDLVVLLSHEGIEKDREIARTIAGIDVIVGGHSHTRLDGGEWVGGVLILQAGSSGRYLGRADLTVKGDSLADARCRLIPVLAGKGAPPPEIERLVATYEKRIDGQFGAVIAEAPEEVSRCYYCESPFGRWITDRMREAAGTDVALLNSGGIREDLAPGPVTKLDLMEVLPFGNLLCRFSCTGAELIALARHNAEAEATEDHGILQVSGLEYSWWASPEGMEIPVALAGGRPIEKERMYTVATVDFVATSQPEKYLGFTPRAVETLDTRLTDAIVEAAERLGRIEAPRETRTRRVEVDFAPSR